jgi:hypothetical protein
MEKAKSAVWANDRLKLIRESSGRAGRESRRRWRQMFVKEKRNEDIKTMNDNRFGMKEETTVEERNDSYVDSLHDHKIDILIISGFPLYSYRGYYNTSYCH